MEIFIQNLDVRTTQDELLQLLSPLLENLQIRIFDVHKRKDKTFGNLTITNISKANELLAHTQRCPSFLCSPSGKQARFSVSNRRPNPQLLRVLHKVESASSTQPALRKLASPHTEVRLDRADTGGLEILSIECGRWQVSGGSNEFVPYYLLEKSGSIISEGRSLVVKMNLGTNKQCNLVFKSFNIYSLSLSRINESRTLTITSELAPDIIEEEGTDLIGLLAGLLGGLDFNTTKGDTIKQYRICGLPGSDSITTGTCLTYRLVFQQNVTDLENRVRKMVPSSLPLTKTSNLSKRPSVVIIGHQISELNTKVALRRWSFSLKFQIHALWANALLSPNEVQQILPTIELILARSGEVVLIKALQRLVLQLPFVDARTDPQDGGATSVVTAMLQQEEFLVDMGEADESTRDEVSIHRVTVTPTGVYLYGPEDIAANRVLRQYRTHQDCFVRVLFADENEERVMFDPDVSNEKVFRGRFLAVLRDGLNVAGEHFDFLGFSHSSLRSQTCWFMRPFVHHGSLMFAKNLINQLGDFSGFRCPAKCAARIGQAFSETTSGARIDASIVKTIPDVESKSGLHTFTDGCGTISEATWRLIGGNVSRKEQPTSYQIRYKGAKGMITLDRRLDGHQIRLRKSMIKFEGSPANEIEICGSNAQPLKFRLNRQIIKILEDLGVPDQVFEDLQEQAIQSLRLSTHSTTTAIDFLSLHLSNGGTRVSTLLKTLRKIGIQITEDDFIRDVLGALIQVQLREIKHRSQIPVPNARNLYGISDEAGWLEEGQVFVTFDSWNSKLPSYLEGRVAVTRSPALHPGDIQVVQAVCPPSDSWLWSVRNCIVFSQKGLRDLPSMLSGGDLDGDLYHVIFDSNLIPQRTEPPADYPKVNPVDIGRAVTSDDIAGFFVDFMQNDQLGRIAILHQVFADPESTKTPDCLLLAELHSTAVDFSKSGVSIDVARIPRSSGWRPDFMAPSASTKVEKGISRPTEPIEPEKDQGYRYYESDRILGKLYRATDESDFFRELEDDQLSVFSTEATNSVMREVLDWITCHISSNKFLPYLDLAVDVRCYYDSNLLEIMSQYAVHRTECLTEKEVFIGTIIGRSGASSGYQREQSENMKTRFNRDVRDIESWMRKQTEGDRDKFLCLSAACVFLAVEKESSVNVNLSSFGWFAASMCVPELSTGHQKSSSHK